MKHYTYTAPPCDYAICEQLCLAILKGSLLSTARKAWGRDAPIVKCCGDLFFLSNDAFKRISGHAPGTKES